MASSSAGMEVGGWGQVKAGGGGGIMIGYQAASARLCWCWCDGQSLM